MEVSLVTTPSFKCDMCDFTTTTEKGIKTHKAQKHKEQLREREEDNSLDLSLMNQEREEESYSPPLANSAIVPGLEDAQISLCRTYYNCGGCEKIFINEEDLTDHEHNYHPLMCHICFNSFKDNDSKHKHYVEKHFKIHGAL